MMTNVSATLSSNQSVVDSGWCTSASKIVLDAMNIKMSLADNAVSSDPTSSHAAARCEWGPDIDSMDVRELSRGSEIRLEHAGELEMLTKLCILALERRYGHVQTNVPHLQRYMAWISQTKPAVETLGATLNGLDNESILSSIDVLDVATPGRINSSPREDPQANEVEVQMHSAGLNFEDVLVALGIVELPIRQFGLKLLLKVGDRAYCLGKQAYSSYITTPAVFCIRIPDDLNFDEAASMLMPYVTVIHSLVNVGRLEKGQILLIHSAYGGVGLAATYVAQMLGAEVYATVSSDAKVVHLMDNFHVPGNRTFQSHDKSFVSGIMRETNNR
ncbi:hypothetical protein KCU67_g553, partial [Aureobasidium melanogenum]